MNIKFGRRVVILFSLLCVATIVNARGAPAALAVARKSADGLDLPDAAEHRFHVTVPFAATLLGVKPEELGRVFSTTQSAPLLAKKTTEDLGTDWFVLSRDGADVVGLSLTYGRVSKAVMFFKTATNERIAALRKQLDARSDATVKVTINPIPGDGKKQSLLMTFEADPLEFYIATHEPLPKVVDGLRAHKYVDGMNDAEAAMVGDGPGRYVAIYSGDSKEGAAPGGDSVFSDSGTSDVRIELEAKNSRDAKEQALKRHKNLKEVKRIGDLPADDSKDSTK